jgi:hypothetical protein
MRAVIIGTDFIKDIDGSFKAMETNTNIGMDVNIGNNIDIASFTNFILTNSFEEIHLIYTNPNTAITDYTDLVSKSFDDNTANFRDFLINSICTPNNITFVPHLLEPNSITIPHIEDSTSKLVIRLAYDTTALIDDEYSRDNFAFLKLMYDTDSNSIPKSYINDENLSIDSIGTTLRDNGNHPNYCIKKRITPADNRVYPKVYKVNTIEELNNLKSSLEVDEYIQEYIYNTDELINNKTFHYRSVDLVYGELDSLNLYVYEKTNILPIVDNCDFDDSNKVQIWDRPRYLSKVINATSEISMKLDADETTKLVLPDNSIMTANNVFVNDSLKSIQFADDQSYTNSDNFSSSLSSIVDSMSIISTNVLAKDSFNYVGKIFHISLDNGSKFSDVPHGRVFKVVQEVSPGSVQNNVIMSTYENLKIGDELILINNETNLIETKLIQNIEYSFESLSAYRLDVDQSDLFLSMEETENQSKYAILTHNYDYDCVTASCIDYPGNQIGGLACYTGTFGYYSNGSCFRTTFGRGCYTPGYFGLNFTGLANDTGYCNGSKPSDMNLKKNIVYSHTLPRGLRIYTYEFIDDFVSSQKEKFNDDYSGKWQGILAQDLLGTEYEDCLNLRDDRFFEVNYSKLNLELTKI